MTVLGDNIRKYRKIRGITQKQIADAIGMAESVVSNWETGLNKPDAGKIELLCGLLQVDANTLLGWPENIKNDAEILADKILSDPKSKEIIELINNMSGEDKELAISFIKRMTNK